MRRKRRYNTADNMKEKDKNIKKQIIKIVGLCIGLLILWFMIREFISNWSDIKPYLSNMNIGLFSFAILIYAAAFLLTGVNWSQILWKMDRGPGKKEYLNIHMVSALTRYIPGGIWSIVGKAFLCNKKGVDKQAVTVSIILEYVFQIVSSGLFFVLFIPLLVHTESGILETWGTGILTLLILFLLPFGINLGIRILSKIMKRSIGEIRLSKKDIYLTLIRYTAVWLLTGFGLIVLMSAFNGVEFLQGLYLMLSYPVSWVAGFLSPSPNGMGVREGILKILLGESQAQELILLIVLTSRIWTIIGEIVAFIGFKIYYLLSGKKVVTDDI